MKRTIELPTEQLTIVKQVLQQHLYCGEQVWVFGSRAIGTARPTSDLDLIVRAEIPLSKECYYRLMDAFEESELSVRVDVLDWHRTDPTFLKCIEKQMLPVEY